MRLRPFITPRLIFLDLDVDSREALLEFLAARMAEECADFDLDVLRNALLDREALGGTAIGNGVAIPHARLPMRCDSLVGLARLSHPVEFETPDEEPVWLIAFCAVDTRKAGQHLRILARLARVLGDASNREALKTARTAQEVIDILVQDDDPSKP